MEAGAKYHGQKIGATGALTEVPPAPPEPEQLDEPARPVEELAPASVVEQLSEPSASDDDEPYWPGNGWPTVVISGKYGWTLCSESQTGEWHDISRREAWKLAWTYFGNCRHTIYYCDESGRVRMQESQGFIG